MMKILELLSLPVFLLFYIVSHSNANIRDGSQLPRFIWQDNINIRILLPNGVEDTIKLWDAEKIGETLVSCLYEGALRTDRSSSVAVSGCQNDEIINIVIYTSLLPSHTMFNIRNGTTEEVEKVSRSGNTSNADVEESINGRLRKRSISLEDDYDEVAFDAPEPPDPPPFLSLDVKLAFEESLVAKKGTEDAAREYIIRVFTLGKQHFRHASLGVSIRLRAQGPIKKIPNKQWKPSIEDLKDSMNFKDQSNIPVTYFCNSNDGSNIMGISYKRKGCHEKKGVAIIDYQTDINMAAQTYIHECGHWLGFDEDAEEDSYRGTNCEGTGIMSSIYMQGGRPPQWSICSKNRLKKWLNRDGNDCLREDSKVLQLESSCLAAEYDIPEAIDSKVRCDTVIVSGAGYANSNGEYKSSTERVRSRPVYAHVSKDRYIFWNKNGEGWSIGEKRGLPTGNFYHASRLSSLEPWDGLWKNKNGKASGITVKCYEDCPAGYQSRSGDIPGWGSLAGRISVMSREDCGKICNLTDDCLSFEHSWTEKICNLNLEKNPTRGNHKDYTFCIKGCSVGEEYKGHCYLLVETPKIWSDAAADCKARNGSLASINNAGTNAFIANLAAGSKAWIGASDAKHEGIWKWTNGETVTFTSWHKNGQPDNYKGNQNCVVINYKSTGKWDDDGCTNKRRYVCQGETLF